MVAEDTSSAFLIEIPFAAIIGPLLVSSTEVKEKFMTLAELVEEKTEALRVRDVARILDVSVKQIYKMAANGQIPSLRIANTVRFDPQEFAFWLRTKSSMGSSSLISSPPTTRLTTRYPPRKPTPVSKSRSIGISRGSYKENLTEV